MGLLERALNYKLKINETGKDTLIDKIKGPADSSVKNNTFQKVSINELDDVFPEKEKIEDNPLTPTKNTPDIVFENSVIDDFSEVTPEKVTEEKQETESIHDEEQIILYEEITPEKPEPVAVPDKKNDLKAEPEIIQEIPLDIEASSFEDDFDDIGEKEFAETLSAEPVHEEGILESPEDDSFEMPEFSDYSVLYEIQKEFIQGESVEDIYKTVLFSIMGQIGVSSASILGASSDKSKWIILDSNGIEVDSEERIWDPKSGILSLLDSYRGILDVEDLKNDVNLRDDYYRFVSVDARLITPLIYGGELYGAILVGEKIDSDEFTSSDLIFLLSVTDMASQALTVLLKYEELHIELLGLRIEKEITWDVEILQNMILEAASAKELGDIIRNNFYSLGIESFAIFINDYVRGGFYPAYFEKDDFLGFENSGFRIKKDNKLINFYLKRKSSILVENFEESAVLAETFGRDRLKKIDIFVSYPFIISGRLEGFISIFKINPAVELIDVDIRLQKVVRFLFPYMTKIVELDPVINVYNDQIGVLYNRIENELIRSADMKIQLSMILISIKNFKRFHDRFGRIEMNNLFERISSIIKAKLYSADFSVRIDRHKFLLVLPGKDKKYSTMLSNMLKNEISELYNFSDFKLLVSSVISVYPEDGKDIFSLIEVLE